MAADRLAEERIELNAAPATRAHMIDFLKAIESNGRPIADIEQGHISTASCIMANMSMALGRPLVYDPKKRIIVGDAEATAEVQFGHRASCEQLALHGQFARDVACRVVPGPRQRAGLPQGNHCRLVGLGEWSYVHRRWSFCQWQLHCAG